MIDILLKRFRNERVNAVLYGHTHIAKNHFLKDILFFNPGSAVGRFPSAGKSYGLLTVTESIRSEIFYIYVNKPGNVRIPAYILPGAGKLALQKVPVRTMYIGR